MSEIVTHEALRDGQHALNARFDRHETHFNEVTTRLFDKVDKLGDDLHTTSVAMSDMGGKLNSIIDARESHLGRLMMVEASVRTLHDSETARMAERGVLAALARSPFIAWLAAAGAVLWAAILKYGEKAV
jgi:hypothetical protein